ncbi:uncharacterized protein LOC112493929 [Cephus cinctus]|uniref:Uncharacterized protein LOC112493929 n=1 Tax=Cephus cinctus TaxID=211228 RepID=A0AAJ7RC11_CEPCN|nr:uncharacterized protein LOC112493929 [Cephus cinctus]
MAHLISSNAQVYLPHALASAFIRHLQFRNPFARLLKLKPSLQISAKYALRVEILKEGKLSDIGLDDVPDSSDDEEMILWMRGTLADSSPRFETTYANEYDDNGRLTDSLR